MKKATVRALARRGALDLLSASSQLKPGRVARQGVPYVHFIYLHEVLAENFDNFRALIESLRKHYTFVPYSKAVDMVYSGNADKAYLSLSFDDAFESNASVGKWLASEAISACFFIPSDFVGLGERAAAVRYYRTDVGVPEGAMSWNQVERLLRDGHEVGGHTRHHRNMAHLGWQNLQDEVASSAEAIQERIGVRPVHFAWPFGTFSHFSPAAAEAVYGSGYVSCASAVRGVHEGQPVDGNRVCIRRDHVDAADANRHTLYLLRRSVERKVVRGKSWPEGWIFS